MAFDDLKTNRNAKLDNDMKELSDGTLCRLRSDQLRSAYLERAWRPRRRLTALLSDVSCYAAAYQPLLGRSQGETQDGRRLPNGGQLSFTFTQKSSRHAEFDAEAPSLRLHVRA